MSLIKQSLVSSSKYNIKCPYNMSPIGIAIHNTYNDAPAVNEVNYMKSNNNQVSFHIAVDDKEAIQGLPLDRNSWSCGDGSNGQGNRKHISIEICYSKSGGTRFANAEKLAAKVVAELLKKYNWGIDRVKAHRDFANKNCPHRTNMSEFKRLVETELNKSNINTSQPSTSGSYTVKVTTDVLNVRSGPGTNYSITTKVKRGEVYTIVGTNGMWGKLKSGAGWICLDYTSKKNTGSTIKVGSKVKIVGSNYATGQIIPNWVKQEVYTVSKIDGNKALIKEITSWVCVKDLRLV